MKKTIIITLAAMLSVAARCQQNAERVVVAYVTSWSRIMPNPTYMTHINYAFGHVSDDFQGVRIDNTQRLRQIAALKHQNPKLKVMLSVGGWGSGRFSEMADDSLRRHAFAQSCRLTADEYGLDGIDIDWEYPTQNSAGISSSTADTQNFTLLMKDLRKALGKSRLLTLASAASAQYINFKDVMKYVDFVNIMAYDMGGNGKHHAALYPSAFSGHMTASQAVEAHIKAGVKSSKLVMGMPFYGRGIEEVGNFLDYRKIVKLTGYSQCWDEKAMSPYLADNGNRFVIGYDNPRSLTIKCNYIKAKGLLGGMYWDYGGDDEQHSLAKTVCCQLLESTP